MIVNAQQAADIFNATAVMFSCINQLTGTFVDNHTGIHVDNHSGVHIDNHAGVHVDLHEGYHMTTKDLHTGVTTAADVENWLGMRAHMAAQITGISESTTFQLASVCNVVL
jgi:hypothetical protein